MAQSWETAVCGSALGAAWPPAQLPVGALRYTCPNGNPFYVDACGRPTEVLTCAECGAGHKRLEFIGKSVPPRRAKL